MNEAYQEILTDLKGEILRLETLHDGLVAWWQDRKPVPKVPGAPALTTGRALTPNALNAVPGFAPYPVKNRKAKVAVPAGVIRKNDPELIEKGRQLAEPFDAAEMAAAMGATKLKTGSNILDSWKRRGWLVRVAAGQYRRSKCFGDLSKRVPNRTKAAPPIEQPTSRNAPASKAKVTLPFDKPDLSKDEELAKALKGLEKARSEGNFTLVRILQDKVDKLQEELARD